MKVYRGTPDLQNGADVRVILADSKRPLALLLDLANHSPTGFAWGYGGSGPAQLALALLADATKDDLQALRFYQIFKANFVQQIPQDQPWLVSDTVVQMYARQIADYLKRAA